MIGIITTCLFYNKHNEPAIKDFEKEPEIAMCSLSDQTIKSESQFKKSIVLGEVDEKLYNLNKNGTLDIYISSKDDYFVKKNEYILTEDAITTFYNHNDDELRFTWEYGVENAMLLLQNTIEQFCLEKISTTPDLFTYVDWQELNTDMIDIFWVENNDSFIANVPKHMLENHKDKVVDFCNASKYTITTDNNEVFGGEVKHEKY